MGRGDSRTALARRDELIRALPDRAPGVTPQELARSLKELGFSVTERTVQRDLCDLESSAGLFRDDGGKPQRWYRLLSGRAQLANIRLTDAVSLKLVETMLRPLVPQAILNALRSRFDEAQRFVDALPDLPGSRWINKVCYVAPAMPLLPPTVDPDVLANVQTALLHEKQLLVRYQNNRGQPSQLTLHPHGLIQRGPITYLLATADDYGDIRQYVLHRMKHAEERPYKAILLRDFSIERYIEDGQMHFGKGGKLQIRAKLGKSIARLLQESPISASQQVIEKMGEHWLEAEVEDTWQLRWWLMSVINEITVFEPVSLREEIMRRISAAAENYSDG